MSDHPTTRTRGLLNLVPGILALTLTSCEVPDLNHILFQDYGFTEWLWLGTILGMIALAYLLPTVIAIVTKHPAALGIGLLNLTLGWTILIWVAAFIWACIKPGKPVTVIQRYTSPPPLPPARVGLETELEELRRLKDKTLISEEEFQQRRQQLLARF